MTSSVYLKVAGERISSHTYSIAKWGYRVRDHDSLRILCLSFAKELCTNEAKILIFSYFCELLSISIMQATRYYLLLCAELTDSHAIMLSCRIPYVCLWETEDCKSSLCENSWLNSAIGQPAKRLCFRWDKSMLAYMYGDHHTATTLVHFLHQLFRVCLKAQLIERFIGGLAHYTCSFSCPPLKNTSCYLLQQLYSERFPKFAS